MPGDNPASGGSGGGFAGTNALGFIAYVMFPTLAMVTAVFGVILLSRENLAGGLLFFVLLQLWVIGGIVVHTMRKRRAADPAAETEDKENSSP